MAKTNGEQDNFSAVRAVCIGSALLVVGAVWIVVQELLLSAGSLTASSPPVGAVGLFIALLTIVLLLQHLRVRWGLGRKELLVIYCMLVTFFPLASQGLWHRFVGIVVSVKTNGSYPAHVPAHMLPRGPELIRNGEFAQGMKHWEGQATAHTYQHRSLSRPAALLITDEPEGTCQLMQWVPRVGPDGSEQFIPGQKFVFSFDMKKSDCATNSWFSGATSLDKRRWEDLQISSTKDTPADTIDGTGLVRTNRLGFEIPFGVDEGFWLRLQMKGPGRVEIAKVSLFSNESIYQLIEGSSEISAGDVGHIARDDKARLYHRPDSGWQRWLYYVKGYVPWDAWAKPLASWSLLWIAMFGAMFALAAILFREWSDRQKLTFPLTAIPLLLTEPDETRAFYLPKVLRSRALWAGAGTALALYSLNGMHFYNTDFPGIPLDIDLAPLLTKEPWSALLRDGNGFRLRIVLLAVGVAFFMDLQLAFSLWLFFLLCKFYLLVPYYQESFATAAWPGGPGYGVALWQFQAIGSALGIVLVAVWLGRRQLWAVFRKALPGGAAIDDSREPMPYRLAVLVLLGSFVLAGIWGEVAGASWWFGVWSMSVMLVFAVMASRVRAECAAPNMWLVPAAPIVLLMAMGGMVTFGVLPMTYFLLMGNFMCAGYFLMTMPAIMETFQIAKVAGIRRRVIGWVMVIGFVVAVVAGGYTLLNWGYARGLATMRGQLNEKDDFSSVLWRWRAENTPHYNPRFSRFQLLAKVEAGRKLTEDETNRLAKLEELPKYNSMVSVVPISATITCLLAAARLTLLRFPFHPLGFVLACTPLMSYAWGSILIAWLIRFVGLHIGGVRVIRNHLQPYMLGLILGSVLSLLVWDAVGIFKIAQGYTGQIFVTW